MFSNRTEKSGVGKKKKITWHPPLLASWKNNSMWEFAIMCSVSCSALKSITFYLKWKHNRKQEFGWEEKWRFLLFLGIVKRTSVQTVWNAAWVEATAKEGKTLFFMNGNAFFLVSEYTSDLVPTDALSQVVHWELIPR